MDNSDFFPVITEDNKTLFLNYHKVYYENSKPISAELIEICGNAYHYKRKLYKEKNVTEISKGIVAKFNKDGKVNYSYDPYSGQTCTRFYGKQYLEDKCFSKNVDMKNGFLKRKDYKKKQYFENDVLKKIIWYDENNTITGYAIINKNQELLDMADLNYDEMLLYDKDGKLIDAELESLINKLNKESTNLNEKRELLNAIIKRRAELGSDLNLTLEQQFFKKIDKLNKRDR